MIINNSYPAIVGIVHFISYAVGTIPKSSLPYNIHVFLLCQHGFLTNHFCVRSYRDRFVYAPNQWETTLQCNLVSHWLGAYPDYSLFRHETHMWYPPWYSGLVASQNQHFQVTFVYIYIVSLRHADYILVFLTFYSYVSFAMMDDMPWKYHLVIFSI